MSKLPNDNLANIREHEAFVGQDIILGDRELA